MRLIIQRVSSGSVVVDEIEVGAIGAGLVVLVGVVDTDTEADVAWTATRVLGIKLWPNEGGTPWRR
jgi:D-tyrosyl-tRNA(Tyr) deacylase